MNCIENCPEGGELYCTTRGCPSFIHRPRKLDGLLKTDNKRQSRVRLGFVGQYARLTYADDSNLIILNEREAEDLMMRLDLWLTERGR